MRFFLNQPEFRISFLTIFLRSHILSAKMMLQYRDLAKLKTKKIMFEDVFAARDSVTLEHLKELSSKRRVIEDSINQTSFITEAIAREMYGGSTSRCEQERLRLEQYLPLLENFIYHVDFVGRNSQIDRWISQLKIQWSSVLGLSSFFNLTGPKFAQIDNLRFELGMTLFLYGAILRERALEFLPADLKQSAFIFREAAGVFDYLAHEVIPSIHPTPSTERPPEATPSVAAAISLICLAEAQAVYITKAEEIGNTGFGVLAKLHLGVAELLNDATTCLNSGVGEYKSISSRFLEFISSCTALHELRSQKYFAESLKTDGQVGVAIGVIRDAVNKAEKKMPGDYLWKSVCRREIENAADSLRKYESENEFVWHEKIPNGDELPLLQGNKIVKIEPYKPKRWERELAFKT
ncbi:vacuolar-sorting protein BRO1 [Euphorbia lathyris]|uniref:vacuolar-sorting protein BRO1 n=1 Tax=Euphorbia lathyris TaxID=212925 RepID=UPI003313B19C